MDKIEIQKFTTYLQARHLHGKTITDYLRRVNHYIQWLQQQLNKEPEHAEKKDILNYLHYLQTHSQPDMGTRQHTLGMVQRYYAYLLQNNRVLKNPTQLINLRGTRKQRLLKLFTVEELAELADAHYYLCVKYEVNPPNLNLRNHIALLLYIHQGIQAKFISFKQLRASIITHWIQTQGLRKAQYNAGHRYISSTQNYLANDIESLKNDINKYHPIQAV